MILFVSNIKKKKKLFRYARPDIISALITHLRLVMSLGKNKNPFLSTGHFLCKSFEVTQPSLSNGNTRYCNGKYKK